jgi:3-oxoadipate enol-lactonase
MPIVEVRGARLNYRFDGEDDAPVVMLCNSLGTDLSMWDAQVPVLSRRFRILRYDSRGHGRSSVTPGPYTIEQLARDAIGLLDALELPQVRFCGLSMGGMVGQWLGASAPTRLSQLVLCNTAARIGPPEIWNARIDAVNKGGMAVIVEGVVARWYTAAFIASTPAAIETTRTMLLTTPAAGYVACCAAVRDMDQREAASRIAVPTLVVSGAHDAVTSPAEGRFLVQHIVGAEYIELDAAHLSNIEAEAAFTAAVMGFLGR